MNLARQERIGVGALGLISHERSQGCLLGLGHQSRPSGLPFCAIKHGLRPLQRYAAV